MPADRVRLNWPNRITLVRMLLVPAFLIAALQVREARALQWATFARWAAFGIFLLVAVGDGLDGILARRRNAQTELGALLDPAADKMLVISAYVLLASQRWAGPPMPGWVSVIVVSRDVFIALAFVFIRLLTGGFPLHVSWLGKVCTTCQMVTVLAVLSGDAIIGLEGRLALFGLTVVLTVLTGVNYMYQARHLFTNQRTSASQER
ncbi:MAG: CDP-alcohol phosphatidyltransferase family protein [Planctomycetes bacterium]|nr:CDP-alcohol phosphatidyltransferase family protein [Planctomycetota bacterium]